MRRSLFGILALVAVLVSFSLIGNAVWALKNVCPECNTIIEDLDQEVCSECGKIINKCLVCGTVNPVKNDHCGSCSASLAESRVSRTIDKETRDDLKLGESSRARIEVELQQIEERSSNDGVTSEMSARRVQLLTKMGWWSKANSMAGEFSSRFPDAAQKAQVAAWRVIALRNLGFLALEAGDKDAARDYLKTALSIDPKDKKSRNLLKMAGGVK